MALFIVMVLLYLVNLAPDRLVFAIAISLTPVKFSRLCDFALGPLGARLLRQLRHPHVLRPLRARSHRSSSTASLCARPHRRCLHCQRPRRRPRALCLGVLRVYAYVISGSLKRNVRVVPGPGLNVSGIILCAIFTTYLAPFIVAS